jgi:hypothetical protein
MGGQCGQLRDHVREGRGLDLREIVDGTPVALALPREEPRMHIRTKTTVWLLVSATAGIGCGSNAPTSPVAWACANTAVPNGTAFQCTSADSRTQAVAATLGGSYTCPGTGSTSPQCPPPAEDAPPPGDDASPGDDAGLTPPASSPPGADAAPPAEDSPPPQGDAATQTPPSDDAGSPPPSTSGDDAGTPGHGHGNGGGKPPGNSPGNPPGKGGPDAGEDDDAAPPVTSPPPSTNPPGEGSDGGTDQPPPYTCDTEEGLVACTQPPQCSEGTHPSACGACVPDTTTEDCVPPSSGGCWVTGGGFIDPASGQDSFGGNAMPMKSGTIRGEWENVDHGSGLNMHGEPSYLYCRHVDEPGPGADNGPHHDFTTNQAYFGGPARVFANNAWADGYWFDVVVDDHGEGQGAKSGGPDLYHVTIRSLSGPNQSGAILYDAEGTLSGGNIQLHPPNNGHPYSSSTLPTWVTLQP